MALIEYVKENFLIGIDSIDGIECSFWCTDSLSTTAKELDSINDKKGKSDNSALGTTATVAAGRMDVGAVIRSSLEVGYQTTVLVCGPGAMGDETTRHVVNCLKGGFKVEQIEETYTW